MRNKKEKWCSETMISEHHFSCILSQHHLLRFANPAVLQAGNAIGAWRNRQRKPRLRLSCWNGRFEECLPRSRGHHNVGAVGIAVDKGNAKRRTALPFVGLDRHGCRFDFQRLNGRRDIVYLEKDDTLIVYVNLCISYVMYRE